MTFLKKAKMLGSKKTGVVSMEKQRKKCEILGVNVDVTNMKETIEYITQNLSELRGKYICVSNVHTTVMAYKDSEYCKVQNSAAMVLPDGKPLSLVSRKKGFKEARRVAGPDLFPEIMNLSQEKGYTHYLYGTTEDTLKKLKRELMRKYPKLQIVGMYSPPFRKLESWEDEEIVNRINETKADFIWVALGAPKQENWMFEHQDKVCGLMIGVGAAFDFQAKVISRAPRILQDLYLEWLYRIVQDPKRLWKRYLTTNFFFIWKVLQEGKKQCKKD